MMTDIMERVVLAAGGSGIVGRAVVKELRAQCWMVRAIARRPIAAVGAIEVDLTDRAATASALQAAAGTTDLFTRRRVAEDILRTHSQQE